MCIWAAWCSQTAGCVTESIRPAGLPHPGNTSDWGPFLWHEAGPSAAVVLDFLYFHTCVWGPFIWHCCHFLVSGHHHKGCTIHSSFIHITAKSQNYIKEPELHEIKCVSNKVHHEFRFSLLYAHSLLLVCSRSGVLVLEPAGGLRGPVLLLLEVEDFWSSALLRSGAGFCPVLRSFLSQGLRCFALGCVEGFTTAVDCRDEIHIHLT